MFAKFIQLFKSNGIFKWSAIVLCILLGAQVLAISSNPNSKTQSDTTQIAQSITKEKRDNKLVKTDTSPNNELKEAITNTPDTKSEPTLTIQKQSTRPENIININLDKTPEASKELFLVTKVVDGDTVTIDKIGTIRLIGINTPETVDPRKPVECFGKEASDRAKELLNGKKVYLEFDESQGKTDKYNRTLAYVFREDGLHFNVEMIKTGYAYEYTYNKPYKYQNQFKQAQKDAQNSQSGLWSANTCSGQLSSVKDEPKAMVTENKSTAPSNSNTVSNEAKAITPNPQLNTNYDTNGDGKVTCPDFSTPVTDPHILSMFPRLDGNKDGVGCENN